jgi:hypothetical protein
MISKTDIFDDLSSSIRLLGQLYFFMKPASCSRASEAALSLFSTAFTFISDLSFPGLMMDSLSSSVKSWIIFLIKRSVPLWVSSEKAVLYYQEKNRKSADALNSKKLGVSSS